MNQAIRLELNRLWCTLAAYAASVHRTTGPSEVWVSGAEVGLRRLMNMLASHRRGPFFEVVVGRFGLSLLWRPNLFQWRRRRYGSTATVSVAVLFFGVFVTWPTSSATSLTG